MRVAIPFALSAALIAWRWPRLRPTRRTWSASLRCVDDAVGAD